MFSLTFAICDVTERLLVLGSVVLFSVHSMVSTTTPVSKLN
jgi:hypothetical protein